VVVLRLLAHRERAWKGDLDPPVRVRAQELHVAHLDRSRPADGPDDARHGVLLAGPVERDPGVVEVDPLELVREPVRVALAPDLAVGDHVDPCALLVANRDQGRVVLRLLKVRLVDPPQLPCADARRQPAAERLAVDQPVRLRIAADNRRP
jgi:hypothetical protein